MCLILVNQIGRERDSERRMRCKVQHLSGFLGDARVGKHQEWKVPADVRHVAVVAIGWLYKKAVFARTPTSPGR